MPVPCLQARHAESEVTPLVVTPASLHFHTLLHRGSASVTGIRSNPL